MEDNKELDRLITYIEIHLEEEIQFINEICSCNFESYDNEVIIFYLKFRDVLKKYKKEIRRFIKELEKRKDNL